MMRLEPGIAIHKTENGFLVEQYRPASDEAKQWCFETFGAMVSQLYDILGVNKPE